MTLLVGDRKGCGLFVGFVALWTCGLEMVLTSKDGRII
jgi:hypothetical protein